MRSTVHTSTRFLIRLICLLLFSARLIAQEPAPSSSAEHPPPEIAEASGIGTALGAAERCGMPAEELARMRKLGAERLHALAPDKHAYDKAIEALQRSERFGATEMQQPLGGCSALLMVTSGLLGKLTYIVSRADPEVPDLRRPSPLENFAAWAGQLAVMASHCGARDQLVNKATDLTAKYIAKEAANPRIRVRAEAELSEVMLQAELEDWGDRSKCKEILMTFGVFFGNLDSRLQN